MFTNYTRELSRDIQQLKSSISPLFSDLDEEDIVEQANREFEKFHEISINSNGQEVHKELNKADSTMGQLISGLHSYEDKIPIASKPSTATKVLLVDDELYCEIVKGMLDDENILLTIVKNGHEALEHLRTSKPDVILLDYMMPGLNGIMVLKNIKSNPDLRSIPVIILTGDSSRQVVSESMKAGASEYIIKPGDHETVVSKIEMVTH